MAGENNNTLEAEESIIKPRPFPLFNLKGSLHEILGSGKALDLILWRRRNSSIGVIAVATTIWFLFERCGYTLLSFVANVLMLLITILFLWSNAAAILNRPPPPLPELELSEETIYATSTIMHAKINYALKVSREIALGKDLKLFLKVAFVLLITSTVGSWFDLLTIAYIRNNLLHSSYDLGITDANTLSFVLKNAPEAAKQLNIGPMFNKEAANYSDEGTFMALYPICRFFSPKLTFPGATEDIFEHYHNLPRLFMNEETTSSSSQIRKVHLELDLGSLQEIWVAVLNITGPLATWSFSEKELPVPEQVNGGPPSYILRLSGSSSENWKFWIEASSSEALKIDLAVLDQRLDKRATKLKQSFPLWVDVTAYSSFLSSYVF